jgi:hypothetical protein
MADRHTGPGEVKLDDFLARLRIPIRVLKKNIRTIDITHREHTIHISLVPRSLAREPR